MVQNTILKPALQVGKEPVRNWLKLAKEAPTDRILKLQIALSYIEYQQIVRKANAQHLTKAAFIRRAALMQKMPRE